MTFPEVLEELKIYGERIGEQYNKEKNKDAELVISYYQMVYTCPGDMAAQTFLIESFKDWKGKYVQ